MMRILLICGSLEAGKDGVGDYTQRLGGQLRNSGHEISFVSLNEKVAIRSENEGVSIIKTKGISDFAGIEDHVREWKPDWISLQLVPWGLDERGLIWKWIDPIRRLRKGVCLHILAHEIWLGIKPGIPFKQRVLGYMQRMVLRKALSVWRPECMHVTNGVYQSVLESDGYRVKRLPLFGNIPVMDFNAELNSQLNERIPASVSCNPMVIFLFSIHPDFDPFPVLEKLRIAADICGASLSVLQAGNVGRGAGVWKQIAGFAEQQGWPVLTLGQCRESIISGVMQKCCLAVSSYNYALAEKSGGIISAWEHGLPVICANKCREAKTDILSQIRNPVRPHIYDIEQMSIEDLVGLIRGSSGKICDEGLEKTAQQFLTDLFMSKYSNQ